MLREADIGQALLRNPSSNPELAGKLPVPASHCWKSRLPLLTFHSETTSQYKIDEEQDLMSVYPVFTAPDPTVTRRSVAWFGWSSPSCQAYHPDCRSRRPL